eukprot:scaffold76672_cov36-Tisochrysis_lutea.AAC.1
MSKASCPSSASSVVHPSFLSSKQRMVEAVGVSSTTRMWGDSRALRPRLATSADNVFTLQPRVNGGGKDVAVQAVPVGEARSRSVHVPAVSNEPALGPDVGLMSMEINLRPPCDVLLSLSSAAGCFPATDREVEARIARLGVVSELAAQGTHQAIGKAKADSKPLMLASAGERELTLELEALQWAAASALSCLPSPYGSRAGISCSDSCRGRGRCHAPRSAHGSLRYQTRTRSRS